MTITPEQSDEACAKEAWGTLFDQSSWQEREALERVIVQAARLSREREAARHAEPPVDQDVLDVRRLLAAEHDDDTILSGVCDDNFDVAAVLATYRAIKAERGWP